MFLRPVQAPVLKPFPQETVAAVNQWWLSGGIASANCLGAYQAKGAASLAASYSNLANPGTYDLTLGLAPTWDTANGWIFNGSTQYLRTGIVPAAGWSMICRFSNQRTSADNLMCGSIGPSNTRFFLGAYFATKVAFGNGGAVVGSVSAANGVLAIAGQQGYLNGSTHGGAIGAWSGTTTADVYIGRVNYSSPYWAGVYVQSLSIYNTTISAAQVLAVTNAMNAL